MLLRLDWQTPIYPVAPEIDLDSFQSLIAFEAQEIAGVFRQGRLVLQPKRGGPDAVGFRSEERPFLKDAILVHNHPEDLPGPLSGADAFVAAQADAAEIRAVSPRGRLYRLVRSGGGWPNPSTLEDIGDESYAGVLRENARRRRMGWGEMTRDEEDESIFRYQQDAFASVGVAASVERWND